MVVQALQLGAEPQVVAGLQDLAARRHSIWIAQAPQARALHEAADAHAKALARARLAKADLAKAATEAVAAHAAARRADAEARDAARCAAGAEEALIALTSALDLATAPLA